MDKINFLITEVSLECLGNKFFDIYGTQVDSLLRLISVNSLKPKPTDADNETDLYKSLKATEVFRRNKVKNVNRQAAAAAAPEPVINKKQPKRRASFSTADNETDAANDPESLLMPMAPKAAKIMNRRSTISVQLAKRNNKSNPIATNSEKIQTKIRKQTSVPVPSNPKMVANIRKALERNSNARKYCFGFLLKTIN